MAEILNDVEDQRVVVLSRRVGKYDIFQETLLEMTEDKVTLLRLREGSKSKSFSLALAEMDTLAEAWVQFRADQKERREAEKRKLAEELEQLKMRVAALGGTVTLVSQDPDGLAWYDVEFKGRWAHCGMRGVGRHRIKERVEEIEHTLAHEEEVKATSSASDF